MHFFSLAKINILHIADRKTQKKENNMAEKKPKSIESELHKKAARPNTAPIVNKKTQQKKKKKKKKNPQADKKIYRKWRHSVLNQH